MALRRKIRSPTNPFDREGVSPAKAMRMATARACEDVAKFEVVVTGFDEDDVILAQIVCGLKISDLIVKIKAPTGAVGLAIWNIDAVSIFIEQLVTRRVVASETPDRTPTATDAAVLSEVLNAILLGFDTELPRNAVAPPVAGFRKTGIFADGRALSMGISDVSYRRYRVDLDLCNGAKSGILQLIFPLTGGTWHGVTDANPGSWQKEWHGALADTSAGITAILSRSSIPLGSLKNFEIGTQVPVPKEALNNVMLEGSDQRSVAVGRLGQSNGHRAVMISYQSVQNNPSKSAQPFEKATPPSDLEAQVQIPDLPVDVAPIAGSVEPEMADPLAIQLDKAAGITSGIE